MAIRHKKRNNLKNFLTNEKESVQKLGKAREEAIQLARAHFCVTSLLNNHQPSNSTEMAAVIGG